MYNVILSDALARLVSQRRELVEARQYCGDRLLSFAQTDDDNRLYSQLSAQIVRLNDAIARQLTFETAGDF